MRRCILLCLVVASLIIAITSCSLEYGTGTPVEIAHNPKNLLTVEKSDYSFSRREVSLWFTTPSDFGATGYTLQFSPTNAPYSFQTVKSVGGDDLTTTLPNASGYGLAIPSSNTEGYFRLQIHGGKYDGQFSNTVFATQTASNLAITWSLDYSMDNTGIMSPRVGFGIVASFTVIDRDDSDKVITDALDATYKWYRVNPNDFEDREEIVGQTDLSYTTQASDIDHYILVIAKGTNEKFSGGFCYAMTGFVIRP